MKKLKKSLAVILAIIMIASFTPLFASAATAASPTNCTLTENSLKYKLAGADDSTASANLVVPYRAEGYKWTDFEMVGAGEVTDNATGAVVEGEFAYRSASYGKAALNVGFNSPYLKFTPTDRTTYSIGSWRGNESAPIKNFPVVTVEGLPAEVIELPTVTDCNSGSSLTSVTFSGGKVVDGEGNDITAEGTWYFVTATTIPSESGNFDVKWYSETSVCYASVYVNVLTKAATLQTAPVFRAPPGKRISTYQYISELTPAVIVDENGTDITANGTWEMVDTPDNLIMMKTGELKYRWTAKGYEAIETMATVEILTTVYREFDKNWYIQKEPVLVCPDDFVYSQEGTKNGLDGIISYTPGVIVDEDGNEVPGTWSYYTYPAGISIGTKNVTPIFTPEDTTCPEIEQTEFLNQRDSITINKGDYDICEGFEVVLQYGTHYYMPLESDDLKFSNLPLTEGLTPYTVAWDLDTFDPYTADYNSVTYVEATISLGSYTGKYYNTLKTTIPVRIQPYTIANYNDYLTKSPQAFVTDTPSLGLENDAPNGRVTINVNFTTTKLKGDYVVTASDGTNTFDVMTIKPDENGNYNSNLAKWQAPASGTYTFSFTYVPSEEDSAVFADDALKTYTYSQDVEVNIRQKRNVTVKMGNETYKTQVFEGDYETIALADVFTGSTEGYIKWFITDENGNTATYTPSSHYYEPDEFRSHIQIGEMPAHDLIFIASKTETIIVDDDGNVVGGGALDSFLAFWNKIVDFIVKIYQMMYDMFKF